MAYSWPGNIRELENALEMAMIFAGNRSQLDISDFSSLDQPKQDRIEMTGDHLVKLPDDGLDFESVIARIELNLLEQALQKTAGNKKLAADLLRLKRTTLNAKLKTLTDP
jgi:transcriptional regulator with PAS, ATPase and Fis domain